MSSAKDEVARRPSVRRDPRVDQDSIPAMPVVTAGEAKAALRESSAPRVKKHDPRAEPESLRGAHLQAAKEAPDTAAAPAAPAEPADAVDVVDVEMDAASRGPAAVEGGAVPLDPRLAELEPLFNRSAWKDIAERLGPPEKAADLPPALALVYALARREAAGDDVARGATELAIKSMAALLGVAPGSATALVLAKRLLRQNPASWSTRPAPRARLSLAIILIGIAVGVAAGSFLSLEAFRSFKLF